MEINIIKIDVQYFEGCPHAAEAFALAKKFREENPSVEIDFLEVKDNNHAARIQFRGSPTILINGKDWLGEPAPENPSLSCRFYPHGLPDFKRFKQILAKFSD